jgi:protein farnesyltransferase/geranylgeranyltransferase type-1 subunit alpha
MEWLRGPTGLKLEKNYQIWHHRRCIAEILADGMDFNAELEFLKLIFQSDSKNYHAWSYRVWLVERFSLWEGELEYAESLLDEEVTNNSAWSYRYFILNRQPNS